MIDFKTSNFYSEHGKLLNMNLFINYSRGMSFLVSGFLLTKSYALLADAILMLTCSEGVTCKDSIIALF